MIAYILITLGFFMRLIPHVPNIVPIAAIVIFAGAYLDKRIVPWLPLAIMALSDLIIGVHQTMFFTWGAFILIGFMATRLKDNRTMLNMFGGTVLAAIAFFIISNFGAWLVMKEYPLTANGLFVCYVRAIPFFRNALVSNVVFIFVFSGVYEFAKKHVTGSNLENVLLAEHAR